MLVIFSSLLVYIYTERFHSGCFTHPVWFQSALHAGDWLLHRPLAYASWSLGIEHCSTGFQPALLASCSACQLGLLVFSWFTSDRLWMICVCLVTRCWSSFYGVGCMCFAIAATILLSSLAFLRSSTSSHRGVFSIFFSKYSRLPSCFFSSSCLAASTLTNCLCSFQWAHVRKWGSVILSPHRHRFGIAFWCSVACMSS